MNNQEIIANLNMISVAFVEPVTKEQRKLIDDTFDNAKKALEQEPCDNAVSRQAALDAMYELCNTGESLEENPWRDNPHIDAITDAINNLPPVNPQEPKTGQWVHGKYCSECGCDVPAYIIDWKWQKDMDAKYCPNCGARMVEPQERSEE